MKQIAITIIMLIFLCNTSCQGKGVNKEALLNAFIHHESRGIDHAVNPTSRATGCLQIMPIMVREANRLVGYERFKLKDRLNRKKSIEIFHVIMSHKNPTYNIERACRIWNPRGGGRYLHKIRSKYYELNR